MTVALDYVEQRHGELVEPLVVAQRTLVKVAERYRA
jgi:hypothetical protein